MFSKSRTRHSSSNSTRSSLKHTTNNDSLVTLTKDPIIRYNNTNTITNKFKYSIFHTTQTTTQSMWGKRHCTI